MLECPSHGRGNDLAARPDVAILQTVARTANCRFANHVGRDTFPFVGAVRAKMERSVRDRVSVVGDIPSIFFVAGGSTERTLSIKSNDVFWVRFGQCKNSGQDSVLPIRFRDEGADCSPVLGVGYVPKWADSWMVGVRLRALALQQAVVLRDVEHGARGVV